MTPTPTTRATPATPEPRHFTLPSPVGPLHLTASDDALLGLAFGATTPPPPAATTLTHSDALGPAGHPIFTTTVAQLALYFAGKLTHFELPLGPVGTDFQRAVWSALCTIPYGVAIAYGDLARQLGRPSATRAVGAANGRNPIGIIVPCHRVIGANGSLTGFGGGLDAKRWLLAHESRHTPFALAPGV